MKKTYYTALLALSLTFAPNHSVAETPDKPEATKQCVADLSQIDVPQPFEGISDISPGMAPLAAVANWYTSVTGLHWIDPRSGISWEFDTLVPTHFACRRLDRWGNTIAELRFSEGLYKTWSYWENTSRKGQLAITRHFKKTGPDTTYKTYRPTYELYILNGTDEIRGRSIGGLNPGDDFVVGQIESRLVTGELVLVVDESHRLHLDQNGSLVAHDYWPCGRTDPCTESPEKTEYFYDHGNNLVRRSYSYGGAQYINEFSLLVNERGDWIVRKLVDNGNVWRTRKLMYFESGLD